MKIETEQWLIDLEPEVLWVDVDDPPSPSVVALRHEVDRQVVELRWQVYAALGLYGARDFPR